TAQLVKRRTRDDDDECEATGRATKIYSEDLHSHEFYLLAVKR
ncbi:hypothetical protein LCGC14_2364800, partial [marine sediment metagenome]